MADHLHYTDLRAETHETSFAPLRQVKQAYKQAILADAGQMYATDVEVEIRARAPAFADKGKGREPKAVEVLMHGLEQTLSYVSVDFPRTHVLLIRTTNLLEHFYKEIRRKQRDIGMFQSETGGEVFW
jgi:transposase-like protein